MADLNLTAKAEIPATGYYTYALVDPRDGKAFYIGKGKGRRVFVHAANARNGKVGNNEAKHARICEIHDAGLRVCEVVLNAFAREREALADERQLIATTPGLLNIAHGCVSSGEAVIIGAKYSLSRMKTMQEWIDGLPAALMDQVNRVFGSPENAYKGVRSGFEAIVHG